MGRIKHFRLVLALMASSLFAMSAWAMPVKPDLGKILKQQEHRNHAYEPAQAGWNGPEMQRPQDAAPNPVLETFGPAATVRSIRAALMAAAIPDPSAVVAIAVLILLMRIMRQTQERRRDAVVVAIRPHTQEEGRKAA